MASTPYEILTFVGRGASARDYQRLKAGLDRLQSTTVATSIRQAAERRRHRFSWVNEWKEKADAQRQAARDRADPAGLVLRRGPRRRARSDHRPRIFRADRRSRALALPDRSQAWRPPGIWLELRPRLSPRQVRQPLAAQALRLRHPRDRPPPAAPRLQPRRSSAQLPAPSASRSSHPRLTINGTFRAARGPRALGTSCELPRAIEDGASRAIGDRKLVLSGTEIGRNAQLFSDLRAP